MSKMSAIPGHDIARLVLSKDVFHKNHDDLVFAIFVNFLRISAKSGT